jgi:hypothetical protein
MQIENLSGIAGRAGRCHACAQQYNRKRPEYLKAQLFLFKEKQSRAEQSKAKQSKAKKGADLWL